jgi:hypothetical protein
MNAETVKEVQVESVEVESILNSAAVRLSSLHRKVSPHSATGPFENSACRIKKTAHLLSAIRSFPLFDRTAINKWERRSIPVRLDGKKRTYNLWVPVFGTCSVNHGEGFSISLRPTQGQHMNWGHFCPMMSYEYQNENREEMSDFRGMENQVELRAKCPGTPADVIRRLDEIAVSHQFDNVSVVFEAQWAGEIIKDPLVIGTLLDVDFLLDQYDVTKMERYIVSEFCQKPPEEE